MNENFSSNIDLSKKAIDQWNTYTTEEKDFWRKYFHLRPIDLQKILSFPPYTHAYRYTLDDEDVAKVVFCAVVEIVRYNFANGMKRAFFGNSGGLDSATTCALLAKAVQVSHDIGHPFDVVAYGMPIKSNPEHHDRAEETAKTFGIQYIRITDLDSVLDAFHTVLNPLVDQFCFSEEEQRRGFGNVKARIRMIVNFFGTTQPGSYVVSTDNLSELYMAFWTLMGDVGGFAPIQNIFKGLELPSIAYALGVPDETLGAKPTDGLEVHISLDEREGGDADAFGGIQYPHLDAIICHATKAGLDLAKLVPVRIDADLIASDLATQERVDSIIATMVSPGSVWKRLRGSIGTSISRDELGLISIEKIGFHLTP